MQKLNKKYINSVVKKALDEDLKPKGDITTNLISLINFDNKFVDFVNLPLRCYVNYSADLTRSSHSSHSADLTHSNC